MPVDDCGPQSICAVVVTFHPDGDVAGRLRRVAPQVGLVVVVDNRSPEKTLASLEQVVRELDGDLIRNPENRGVATALNQGVRVARGRGFQRALLLDQDSIVSEDLIAVLCAALSDHPEPEKVAVVAPNYIELANGRRLIESDNATSWVPRRTAITSGSLLSLRAFDALGGFRDELFIDEVDTDFCFRARAAGYHVIATTRVAMEHTIGNASEEKPFLWRTARPVNYSATRWYYISRNTTVLAGEHWRRDPRWVLANVYGHAKWLAKALIYEEDRWGKSRAVLQGVAHALRGRLGPRP
jgi:rhamnosyltransferase